MNGATMYDVNVFVTKDGIRVLRTDWIYDTTGVYEIASLVSTFNDEVILREIIFPEPEENPDLWIYGEYRTILKSELAKNFYYC